MTWLLGGAWGGKLVFTGDGLAIGLAVLASVATLGLAFRPAPVERRRAPEWVLLAAALGLIVWMVSRPVLVAEGERAEEGRLVVLVDASRSMGVAEPEGGTRLAVATALASRLGTADIYHFGGDLRSGQPLAAELGATNFPAVLQALARRYAGERLAGVVLVTDGIDRGGLVRDGKIDASLLPDLPGPLTIYQVGRDRDVPDLAVTDFRAGSFAFLRAPFTLAVDVAATGLAVENVAVSLTRNGQPAGAKSVRLGADGKGSATFTLTPDSPGRYIYEASVAVPEGDAVPTNNAMSRAIRVVRDRVRVLQVCGSPSMDQKFLRLFLKEDPGVDLVSFFILRTLEDFGSGYRGSELSLIEFPYRRLFADDLATFDLVILQNFDYQPYFEHDAPTLLANLGEYVERGGALAMIGGDRSFDLGAYGGTPVAGVLPVKLGLEGEASDAARFRPALTGAGARHPVTRLAADPAENAALWSGLGDMDGLNLNDGAVPGAAVLLEHPARDTPVLAVRQVGKGRTLSLAVDSSWRWAFGEAGKGGGNQAYLRFWKNAMRWLVGDPDDQAVTIDVARENVEPGEKLRVTVRVRDAGFAPVVGANVVGAVDGPEGQVPLSGPTGADGLASFEVPTVERGAHRVKVSAQLADGKDLGQAESVYAVVTRDAELDRIDSDGQLLRALAEATGGRHVEPGSFAEPLRDPAASRVVRDREETALWAAPLWPLLAGAFATASWVIRRRLGRR
ncbi:MAG: hypothetical protein FJ090_05475 [Deltaproteobacteria bacterium]|nr:hypothetical protein [Deltaproteobacteria bacterium]